MPHRAEHVRKLAEKPVVGGGKFHFCDEAGRCGYDLHRQVVAPSLNPVMAGDRVKTDRRDAVILAKPHRAGEMTAVWVPNAAHEAICDCAAAMRVTGKAR
ncbi:hypothetical protein [Paracoccus aurantius]|uniref:hypothetical protein n=1 Tax=Paracoccus aurantius TaxID=3073814 RepID=UPI0038FD32EE